MVKKILCGKKGLMSVFAWVLVLIFFVSSASYYAVYLQKSSQPVEIKASSSGSVTYGDDMYLSGDGRTPAFRANAKFKIIELVPYHGMAEIGYTIGGEEPITYDNIASADWNSYISQFTSSQDSSGENIPLSYDTITGNIVNNDLFIKTTLRSGLDLTQKEVDDYIANHLVDVLVLEPSQINANPDLIDEADMIYIDGDGNDNVLSMYKKYSKEFQTSGGSEPDSTTFTDGCDISFDVALKLYEYSCVEKSPLVIKGVSFANNEKATLNMNRFALMLVVDEYVVSEKGLMTSYKLNQFFKGLSSDSNAVTKDENNTDCSLWTYKGLGYALSEYLSQDSSDSDALKKMKGELSSGIVDLKAKHENSSYFGKIDTTTVIVSDHTQGADGFISNKMGNADQLSDGSDLCSDVKNDTRDVAIAIYNGQKPSFVVLDLEPDHQFPLKYSDVKSWMPENEILYKVVIEQMTMSEFIGSLEDINAQYDLIYLGDSKDKMKEGSFYYTDSSITASSDQLKSYTVASDSTDDTEFTYSGNDMTEKKEDELGLFLNAGFPVVYESDLTSDGTGTRVEKFIQDYSSKSNLYGVSNKSMSGTISESYINTGKPEIYLTLDNTVEEYTEGSSTPVEENGLDGLEFNTKYGDSTAAYRSYLYVDTNHDGIYNKWKQDSGSWVLETSNYGNLIWEKNSFSSGSAIAVNSCSIPADAMNGVVSWKLEVVKLSGGTDTGIRSCYTGDVYCGSQSDANTINVLQIGDIDLTGNQCYNDVIDSSIVKRDYTIKTTFWNIRDSFDDIEFEDFDVIIVGFLDSDAKLTDGDKLLNKLDWAANKGKGVIFTQDALSYFNSSSIDKWGPTTNQRIRELLHLDPDRVCSGTTTTIPLNQMAFTYSVLNQFSASKYFTGLDDNMASDAVTMANDGKITRYPYMISEANTDGFAASSGIYQADLENMDDVLDECKVYYCLDGGNYSVSPNDVRNNYYLLRSDSVFYSGITEDSFSSNDYLNEQKLFVNTIISAYGLERGIYTKVTDLPSCVSSFSGNSYIMYVDLSYTTEDDADDADELIDKVQEFHFKVTQKGLTNPTVKGKFFVCDADGNKLDYNGDGTIDDGDAIEVSGTSSFEPKDSGTDTVTLTIGEEYSFQYPLTFLSGNGSNTNYNILMEAEVDGSAGAITDSYLVRVLRRTMFDLD